ncbi:hypothetical protein GDO78_004651 [Eleutherodactylus coqui]|uniref:Uncharacterized protein n=1 Tax=Eleutherodactylus coqui TaxID=57060 RepID=A0A8J6ERF8_ELECQ|nr:hypothetical protein GDO78_004651 [Eleutherodactylus coqui]
MRHSSPDPPFPEFEPHDIQIQMLASMLVAHSVSATTNLQKTGNEYQWACLYKMATPSHIMSIEPVSGCYVASYI